jgi:small-conductance mechanosensitive channel
VDAVREWLSWDPELGRVIVAVLLVAVVALRATLHRTRVGRRLDSAMTLIALGLVLGEIAALSPERTGVFLYLQAAFIAAVGIGVARTLLILFVDYHLRETRGAAVSTIVRDVGSVLVYFIIILTVLRVTLDLNLASLVATSAVLTAIIGLAFQDVLGSVISGLVLELENPFGPLDWVRVGSFEGRVVETGWRTTKIRTRVNEVITLPNTYLAREPVVNYSRPDPRHGDTLHFSAAYEAPPHAVKQAVHAVLSADPAVLEDPPIEVRTNSYGASGIDYAIRYWIDDFTELERIRDRIMTNIWYALGRAEVRMPFAAHDVFMHTEVPRPALSRGDALATLGRVPLLEPLAPEDLQTLAASARRLIFARGEAIVREGEQGRSFYVIERGAVSVILGRTNGGAGRTIAHLGPGDFFGEMSVLAGEPRSATVLAEDDTVIVEVGHESFQKIVAAHPAILEPISEAAARRLSVQQEFRRAGDPNPGERAPNAQNILQRIRTFFGL